MPESMVRVNEVSVRYGSTWVLDRVNLTLAAGSALCLMGENGAGKSTLLRCVTGLTEPDSGSVRVFGETPDDSAAYWRRVAATVEHPSWYVGLTVREHLELVRLANGADPADGTIDRICAEFGLAGLRDGTPDTLSSGQRQRFLLAAVLVRPSQLLVLDEPEQRLDTSGRRVVASRLRDYVQAGGAVLMASHDPDFVAVVGATVRALDRPVGPGRSTGPAPRDEPAVLSTPAGGGAA